MEGEFTANRPAPWVELIEGSSSVLLIAPHGGRAGAASRAALNPKVNDLYTAQIARALAQSLSASALINTGMDRNQLDCNRLSELAEHAPWLLQLIADRTRRIARRPGPAIVLIIHGWNVIEPRVDFGVGGRLSDGRLIPAGGAHISASDQFISRTLAQMAEALGRHRISASFGSRYPAGGLQNLLQAFTPRHLESPCAPLRQLAALAARSAIEAAQLELSVAIRMPGSMRTRTLEAITSALAGDAIGGSDPTSRIAVVRSVRPRAAPALPKPQPTGVPGRAGIEFYDAAAEIGVMASFDLGPGAIGARIMVLLDPRRVALFTSEGTVQSDHGRVALGPLSLEVNRGTAELRFSGPLVMVPDAAAYLSIERALASGRLDEAAHLSVRLEFAGTPVTLEQLFHKGVSEAQSNQSAAAFGRLKGAITIGGGSRAIDAVGRVGLSFTALGGARFVSRRMIWACFPAGPHSALEARLIFNDDHREHTSARVFGKQGWVPCDIARLELDARSIDRPPHEIAADLTIDGATLAMVGTARSFVPLSRPGPGHTRIYSGLGFASFRLGTHDGYGMFEYSRRTKPPPAQESTETEDDAE